MVLMMVVELISGCMGTTSEARLDPTDWDLYRQRFITPEGRVVDTGNGNITHSEAQGFGMLLATAYDDREHFDRIWNWTRNHLQVRGDRLFAWKWEPGESGTGLVADPNNATDGDLLIAWALARAGRRWERPELTEAARLIGADVRRKMVRPSPYGPVLLPGEVGFVREEGVVVNLSYWCFPAFKILAGVDPDPLWSHLDESGMRLLGAARFGRWGLAPDWLRVSDDLGLPEGFNPRFGYNAIRIPLYLVWAGYRDPGPLQPFLDYWDYFDGARFLSVWTDLTNDSIDSYDAPPGIKAVVILARSATAGTPPILPALDGEQDYYSASLLLAAKLAALESEP